MALAPGENLNPEDATEPEVVEEDAEDLVKDGEECRMCLSPAFLRPCCSQWYCNECYYKVRVVKLPQVTK